MTALMPAVPNLLRQAPLVCQGRLQPPLRVPCRLLVVSGCLLEPEGKVK